MALTLPPDCNYELSDHFVQRWIERTPDSWDRFVWVLTRGAHHIMCEDASRKTHLLHYNPVTGCWFVFFYSHNARTGKLILISILPEIYYVNVSNSAPAYRHKADALALLIRRQVLPGNTKTAGLFLSFRISTAISTRVIEFPLRWGDVSDVNDLYPFHVDFNGEIDRLISNQRLSDVVYSKYPVGVKIYAVWLTVIGTPVVVDVELNEDA